LNHQLGWLVGRGSLAAGQAERPRGVLSSTSAAPQAGDRPRPLLAGVGMLLAANAPVRRRRGVLGDRSRDYLALACWSVPA
jgi:hypothetical protein